MVIGLNGQIGQLAINHATQECIDDGAFVKTQLPCSVATIALALPLRALHATQRNVQVRILPHRVDIKNRAMWQQGDLFSIFIIKRLACQSSHVYG